MARRIIALGATLRLNVSYADFQTGSPVDPATIEFKLKNPAGTVTTVVWPTSGDPAFVQEATGEFFMRVLPVMEGTHHFRFKATLGSDIDVRNGAFDVTQRPDF